MVVRRGRRAQRAGAGGGLARRRVARFRDRRAQAVAALAYGTATVGAVDKIVGPQRLCRCAKRRVFGRGHRHDRRAHEILVIADGGADPDWIAMDLFSQAEHDELAQALLLTPTKDWPTRSPHRSSACCRDSATRHHRSVARSRGALVLTRDLDEAVMLCNRVAPSTWRSSPPIRRRCCRRSAMRCIFLGHYSSEALGDYCAGRTTCCRPCARPAFLAARRVRLRQALEPHQRVAAGAQRLGRSPPCWRAASA